MEEIKTELNRARTHSARLREEVHLVRTTPDSSRVEDMNQGPPDFKSSALIHSATLPPIQSHFLMECRKTKTNVLTRANQKEYRQSSESIQIQSKYM